MIDLGKKIKYSAKQQELFLHISDIVASVTGCEPYKITCKELGNFEKNNNWVVILHTIEQDIFVHVTMTKKLISSLVVTCAYPSEICKFHIYTEVYELIKTYLKTLV